MFKSVPYRRVKCRNVVVLAPAEESRQGITSHLSPFQLDPSPFLPSLPSFPSFPSWIVFNSLPHASRLAYIGVIGEQPSGADFPPYVSYPTASIPIPSTHSNLTPALAHLFIRLWMGASCS